MVDRPLFYFIPMKNLQNIIFATKNYCSIISVYLSAKIGKIGTNMTKKCLNLQKEKG